MGASAASDLEPANASRGGGIEKAALFAGKLLVTGACFWYVSRQIDLRQALSAIPTLNVGWALAGVVIAMLQLPLLGLRWRNVVEGLGVRGARMTRSAMIAATAAGAFFAQVLPSVAGEGVRAWLLVRLGCDWRNAVTSVVIDRAAAVGLLIAMTFVILLLPSGFTALGGYRTVTLAVYGALLVAGGSVLLLAPSLVGPLARWRYSRWLATLAADAHRVLFGPNGWTVLSIGCLIHVLTIVIVWSLGRAQGLALPIAEAAVLFTVMIGVALIPISVGGWGLRELAVISLLGNHGVAPEKALLFSVCFGLALAIGSLPGALAWLLYSFAPPPPSTGLGP
jgi:glycosyltransferase 2 family protein